MFGANDSRLLDKNKNIFGIENKKNESYIKLELDISNVNGTKNGLAQCHIFRVGYHPDDRSDVPYESYTVPAELINNENKYHRHTFYVESVFGSVNVFLDGTDEDHKITKTVPANTTATLFIPAASENSVTEGGKPAAEAEGIIFIKYENGKAVYELASGSYKFISNL